MRYFTCLCFTIIVSAATAQVKLNGVLNESVTGKRLAGASVFLSNTSIGTATNDNGEFTLQIPQGKYDLVISFVGYETVLKTISSPGIDNMAIEMTPKVQVLPGVVLESFEKDGWKQWGRFFIQNFIGVNDMAGNCTIHNTDVIKFRVRKKENTLSAIATAPLIIENKALGYMVTYQLESFQYDFKTRYLTYVGYPLFTPMEGSSPKQNRWSRNREEVYEGSVMHFMRTLFRNKLSEEGFVVRRLVKTPNIEKKRVQRIYRSGQPKDSIKYYQDILAQPDENSTFSRHTLIGDSIAFAVDSTTAGLQFDNYLHINYPQKKTSQLYRRYSPQNDKPMSSIILVNPEPIEIQSNGNYYAPLNLLMLGYWSWSEKISTMLPYNYLPEKKEQVKLKRK